MKKNYNENLAMETLKARGLKATPQRIALMDELSGEKHLSIKSIYEKMKSRFPSISVATVYKIIENLLNKNIVEEIHIVPGKKRYELRKGPHAHYICEQCGKINDVFLDENDIFSQMTKKDYNPNRCEIYFYGICIDCKGQLDNESF